MLLRHQGNIITNHGKASRRRAASRQNAGGRHNMAGRPNADEGVAHDTSKGTPAQNRGPPEMATHQGLLETGARFARKHKARFQDWMDVQFPVHTGCATSGAHLGRVSPTGRASSTAAPEHNRVATVVARLAFLELDSNHEGILSRTHLRRAFKHDPRFREFILPLLSLPGFRSSASVEPNLRWDRMLSEIDIVSCGAGEDVVEDGTSLATFVEYFASVSRSSMQVLSPQRPSPRRSRSTAEPFMRKRVDPHLETANMWSLPNARGVQPMGFIPLTSSRSLPTLHTRLSPTCGSRASPMPSTTSIIENTLPSIGGAGRTSPAQMHSRILPSM